MAFSCILLYCSVFRSNSTPLPVSLYDPRLRCAIVVVKPCLLLPFSLFFRLLIGQRVLTLRGYITTSWFGRLHMWLDVDEIILKCR